MERATPITTKSIRTAAMSQRGPGLPAPRLVHPGTLVLVQQHTLDGIIIDDDNILKVRCHLPLPRAPSGDWSP
jgi:hypothetical protein